jgi:hypothetical protein
MGDLKTPWNNPVYPDTSDLGGAGVVSRGSDPNADGDNGAGMGIDPLWPADKRATTNDSQAESSNSVSGLPSLPNRFEPTEKNIENVPDLTRRSPGTIDQK